MKKKPNTSISTNGGARPNAGRPSIPPTCRKQTLAVRVPRHVITGLRARVAAAGHDSRGIRKSSIAIEVERAYDATMPTRPMV